MIIVGNKKRKVRPHHFTYPAHRFAVGLGETFGHHCAVQRQQQPVNLGQGGAQVVQQLTDKRFIGGAGQRPAGRSVGADQRVQLKIVFVRAFDVAGHLVKGGAIMVNHGVAA